MIETQLLTFWFARFTFIDSILLYRKIAIDRESPAFAQ